MPKRKSPGEAIHAALDNEFYIRDCQRASEVAADAVPDGWAKVDGNWMRIERVGRDTHPRDMANYSLFRWVASDG